MRFDELNLEDAVLQGLEAMNFRETTPIQELTIPVILEGKDMIACAQTGTGKTAAYILPLLNMLYKTKTRDDLVRAVIIAPTRELAQQIDMQFEGFSYFLPISTIVVYGGGDGALWDQQKRGLKMGADIVIATPGRLISHMMHSDIDLSGVQYFILDEADRMLDMGFYDDIMQIGKGLPEKRQTILFSATMPPKIRQLAKNILHNPAELNVAISKPNEAILQSAYICYEAQKMGIIKELFSKPASSKTIIFSSSKQKVKELAFTLKRMKFSVAAMHSDLEQMQREEVMLDFKNGKTDILVATDIVARGIDITDIGLVINYDVPHDPEDYIHRIGRTARANAEGTAITFVSETEQGKFNRIEKFLEKDIYKVPLSPQLGEGPEYNPKAFSSFHGNRRNNGRTFQQTKNSGNKNNFGKKKSQNRNSHFNKKKNNPGDNEPKS
ncbi:DEAD/DEAH box helicase [Coprobacter tertius]|uniref:DEAD/DEAH box helicase n=1 Tax=Coprobacter tertius TaxID=2944915 RepID=A0ABT1MIR9_9BACT|nr:DEAD/DEAH box helicase [Coprobacter tertius]MCP9612502.1 DEAD/DEAH box helicase [Coprobacter tertius]